MPSNAVYVGRPTKWGNPFALGDKITPDSPFWPYLLMTVPEEARTHRWAFLSILDRGTAVDAYAWWLYEQPDLMLAAEEELGGHDLVCWCPLTDATGQSVACHADVLLELANPDTSKEGRDH